MTDKFPLPAEIRKPMNKARRLEWWTLFWLASIVGVMFLAMGSSQAMKTAWVEDLLSLLPPIMFLIAATLERRKPTRFYPYGFYSVGTLCFFAAAAALFSMGAFLIYDSSLSLVRQEHPTIGTTDIFGHQIWMGWIMIAALTYSVIPPVILGRMKKKPAKDLADKILHTDADMNSADWQTGLAGIAGILGIAYGYWWADAVAAGLISLSIIRDGYRNCRVAIAELSDSVPRKIDDPSIDNEACAVENALQARFPGAQIRIRETGRYMRAQVSMGEPDPAKPFLPETVCRPWRLIDVSISLEPGQIDRKKTGST